MSLKDKLGNIRGEKATAHNISKIEQLLRIENALCLSNPLNDFEVEREIIWKGFERKIGKMFITREDVRAYLLSTAEKPLDSKQSVRRGYLTSRLVQQLEGDEPFKIDLEGKTFDHLFCGLDTPRPIVVYNAFGKAIGSFSGSYRGFADFSAHNITGDEVALFAGMEGRALIRLDTIKGQKSAGHGGSMRGFMHLIANHIIGNLTAYCAGDEGEAQIHLKNVRGDETALRIGQKGKVEAILKNIKGLYTGNEAGRDGKSIVLAYKINPGFSFSKNEGALVVSKTQGERRFENLGQKERIAVSEMLNRGEAPEKIMEYLRGAA